MTKVLNEYKGVILLFLSLVLVITMMQLRVKELNRTITSKTNQEISYENN